MAKKMQSISLAKHFDAPEHFLGRFGWLCGYSADADFLNEAAELFTRQTMLSRAYLGNLALALMLDPGNPRVAPDEVPGLAHLPMSNPEAKPFSLLHAKVAILGFGHENETDLWHLRLIVSTGNWTRETVEKSLDLAWRVDISSTDLKSSGTATRQACADLKAAWNLLHWLGGHFDLRSLSPELPGEKECASIAVRKSVETWIATALSHAGGLTPRFLDNRKAALGKQLPQMVQTGVSGAKRNYLGMGSGFFQDSPGTAVPTVLSEILTSLQANKLLTASPELDIFVNPLACQGVATSLTAMTKAGFTVRAAGEPSALFPETGGRRSLHAKFIFSAQSRSNSNTCGDGWLYLGSGNLTGPGFTKRMSPTGGNLEAGVVFATGTLFWSDGKDVPPEKLVSNLLPVQWDDDVSSLGTPLAAGDGMPDRPDLFFVPPVAWLSWQRADGITSLRAPEGELVAFSLLGPDLQVLSVDSLGNYLWPWGRPRMVTLVWQDRATPRQGAVPVLDEYGRFAATDLPQIDLDSAWSQLANFPAVPAAEDLYPDEDSPPENLPADPPVPDPKLGSSATESLYPIRAMMQLVENIAAKQTSVPPNDWSAWCTRLEQCLVQAKGSHLVREFAELGLNPLSPLWEGPFRPDFAETDRTGEGKLYQAVLSRVESEWGVALLGKIGGLL